MEFTITGIEQINKKLSTLEPKIQKKVLRQAMRKAMKPVRTAAQSNAPVETGAVRKAIKVSAGKRSRKSISIDVSIGSKNFVNDTFYGAFQEFGWKQGSRKLGNARKQIEGQHFMEKAYESKKTIAQSIAISEIQKGIDKVVEGS